MQNSYCLDTSFFINGWWKHYGIRVFPALWDYMDVLMAEGRVFSCQEVYLEIERQRDDLFHWVRQRKQFFLSPTREVVGELKRVMAHFPNFAAKAGATNSADPWVIAQAVVSGSAVVTYESHASVQKPTKPPKIPDVCQSLSVRCLTPLQYLIDIELKLATPESIDPS